MYIWLFASLLVVEGKMRRKTLKDFFVFHYLSRTKERNSEKPLQRKKSLDFGRKSRRWPGYMIMADKGSIVADRVDKKSFRHKFIQLTRKKFYEHGVNNKKYSPKMFSLFTHILYLSYLRWLLLIGQKNTKVFWHQSEVRTAATVWNWSGKTLSPGALLAVLYFSSCHMFPPV